MDIGDFLIKDSYDYVLQSDLTTGNVYRIGGDAAVNPVFLSGLTVQGPLRYDHPTGQTGFVLLRDANGNAYWGEMSGGTVINVVSANTFNNFYSAFTTVVSAITVNNFYSAFTTNYVSATTVVNYFMTADTYVTEVAFSGNSVDDAHAWLALNNGTTITTNWLTPFVSGDTGTRSVKTLGHNQTVNGNHAFAFGFNHNLNNAHCSAILGGFGGTIIDSERSVIIGGRSHTIIGAGHINNAIVGGFGGQITNSAESGLFSATGIICESNGSAIIGGNGYIDYGVIAFAHGTSAGCVTQVTTGGLLGGTGNWLSASTNSVILGGSGMTLNAEHNTTYVDYLKIRNTGLNNALDKVLVVNNNGNVLYRDAWTFSGTTASCCDRFDAYTAKTEPRLTTMQAQIASATGGTPFTVFSAYTGRTATTLSTMQTQIASTTGGTRFSVFSFYTGRTNATLAVLQSVSGCCTSLTGSTVSQSAFSYYTATTNNTLATHDAGIEAAKTQFILFDVSTSTIIGTTGEQTLNSYTVPGSGNNGNLATDGDKLAVYYGGTFARISGNDYTLRLSFNATPVFQMRNVDPAIDTGWTIYLEMIRQSSSKVRYMVSALCPNATTPTHTAVGEIAGLTLSNNNDLLLTGEINGTAAGNDIILMIASGKWVRHVV